MFVLLDQVCTAMAYFNRHAILFVIPAYHFENIYVRRECIMCRGCSVPLPVTSCQVTEFIGSVADSQMHSLFIVLSNSLHVTTFL
jgi:hypothetical protein